MKLFILIFAVFFGWLTYKVTIFTIFVVLPIHWFLALLMTLIIWILAKITLKLVVAIIW